MSDENNYEGKPTSGNWERSQNAGKPGYDQYGNNTSFSDWQQQMRGSSGTGCSFIILGASIAIGSFGMVCSGVKKSFRAELPKEPVSSIVREVPEIPKFDNIALKREMAR